MGTEGASRVTPRVVLGLSIFAVGIVFLLDNLDVLDAGSVLRFWPVVLIAVGLAKILNPPERTGGVMILLVGGVILLTTNLQLLPASLWKLWPLVLVFIGLSIIFKTFRRTTAAPPGVDSDSRLVTFAFLGGTDRQSTSPEFRGGEATAIMGGCEVDLRKARMAGTEAVFEVFAMWGGVDLFVPEDWAVTAEVVPILGAVEDHTTRTEVDSSAPRPRLILKGAAIMGGVGIYNRKKKD